ncbi:MAG: T9SS type A sorting domain-containing protein [Bacteroidia bacterium]
MKKTLSIPIFILKAMLLICLSISDLQGQQPVWSFAKSFGGNYADLTFSHLSIDGENNIIINGDFFSLNLQIGTSSFSSNGADDVFLAKFDSLGNVLWAKTMGGTDYDAASAISIDLNNNIYITGVFYSDSINFDNITLYNRGISNIFIAKFDPHGNVVWAKATENIVRTSGNDIEIDLNGNILITGECLDSVFVFAGDSTFVPHDPHYMQVFLIKLDSSGNLIWTKFIEGSLNEDNSKITCDASGNCFILFLSRSPSIKIGTDSVQDYSNGGVYLLKLDPSGHLIWGKNAGGSGSCYNYDIVMDSNDNIYFSGSSTCDTLFFDSLYLLNNTSTENAFLAKYDSSGQVEWVKYFGGNNMDIATSIAINRDDGPTITGFFASTSISIDGTILQNDSIYSSDIFLTSFDSLGNKIYAIRYGGTGSEEGYGVYISNDGTMYLNGHFSSDPLILNNVMVSNSTHSYDVFFAKSDLILSSKSMATNDEINLVNVSPNPNSGHFQIDSSDPIEKIIVSDLPGRIVYEKNYSGTITKNISINLSENGMFFIQAQMKGETCTSRVIVSR